MQDRKMTKQTIKTALKWFSELFKKKERVINIEIFNELQSKGIVLVK